MDKDLVDTALGSKKADITIINGTLVNVCTKEIYRAGVAVTNERIAAIGDVDYCIGKNTIVLDVDGKFLVPGLIDSHIHIESSMLTPTRFAETVIPHGTTAVMCDFHEIEIVSGITGLKELLEESKSTPLRVYLPIFCQLPEAPGLETISFELGTDEIKKLLELPEAVSLAEVGPHPIFRGDKGVYECIDKALSLGKIVDGAFGGQKGKNISAAAAAGLTDDHEAWATDEALDRIRSGMYLMMREGTNVFTKNLRDCLRVITEYKLDTRHCSMMTDDVDAIDLSTKGHMDYLVRRAIEEGVDPVTAIQMVTINPAEQYRVNTDVGSISPGKYGDILVVNNLKDFNVEKVIVNGKLVAEKGKMKITSKPFKHSKILKNSVKFKRKITSQDFTFKVDKEIKEVKVLVMKVSDRYLPSAKDEAVLQVKDGVVQTDTLRDVLLVGVAERYGRTGGVGLGFISGFGLQKGAIASTVSHDYHNILVVGANPFDMAFAANHLEKIQGGQIVVNNKEILGCLPLQVGGLMTDLSASILTEKIKSLNHKANEIGCPFTFPFLSLSYIVPIQIYIALPGVYGVSDKGFVDSMNQKVANPILEKKC